MPCALLLATTLIATLIRARARTLGPRIGQSGPQQARGLPAAAQCHRRVVTDLRAGPVRRAASRTALLHCQASPGPAPGPDRAGLGSPDHALDDGLEHLLGLLLLSFRRLSCWEECP